MADMQLVIPDIGGANDAEIIELCVAVGDTVAAGDSVIVLETDKASMEIPADTSGVISAFHLQVGDTCNQGDLLATIVVAEDAAIATAQSDVGSAQSEPVAQSENSDQEPATSGTETSGQQVASDEDSDKGSDHTASSQAEKQLKVPDIGGAKDVEIIEIPVSAGDEINEGDTILVVETDKVTMELPAEVGGKLVSIAVAEGDKINEADLMAVVLATNNIAETAPVTASESVSLVATDTPEIAPPESITPTAPTSTSEPVNTSVNKAVSTTTGSVHAGPAVRMLAREFGVDLSSVSGTGPKGRVLKEDVQAYVKQRLSQSAASATIGTGSAIEKPPAIDFSQFGSTEKQAMSKIHRLTAQNMQRSWLNVPHVTQFEDADITDFEAFRKGLKAEAEQRGTKITPMPFLLKACAQALKALPQFNVSLDNDGEHIIQKHYVHIGMAVDTPAGLVVPVIRDVDQKSIWQLADEVVQLSIKAKERKLTADDMQGGCFTISSLGSIGGKAFTPIVNTPEVAILGVSKADMQPRWNGQTFEQRLMMPLCLSYDHRAINGADAARFTGYLSKVLGDIRHLVM